MKRVVFVLTFLMLFGVSFVDAASFDVLVMKEIGSFDGAVLRVKSPVTKELGDKIYASEYLTKVGMIKFEVETSLDEVFLNVIMTKGGNVVANFDEGPFEVNGSEVLIDKRERVIEEVLEVEEVVENVSEEVEENITQEVEENITQEVVEVESYEEEGENVLISFTGKVVSVTENMGVSWWYSIGGFFVFLFSVVVMFMIMKRGKKVRENIVDEDDKELAYMEKKVKETEARIGKIKSEKEKKVKLANMRAKLAREEAELKALEGKDKVSSEEKIEDIERGD